MEILYFDMTLLNWDEGVNKNLRFELEDDYLKSTQSGQNFLVLLSGSTGYTSNGSFLGDLRINAFRQEANLT